MDPERDGRSESPASSGGAYPVISPTVVAVVGPILALLVAGGLVPLRDTLGVTNVALLITLVVVAATADRSAGAITAVVAALSYNFFHTQPYRSLRIDNGRDTHAGAVFGQIVLVPRAQSGSIRDERRVAVALADQFAAAIALDSPVPS